MFNNNHIANNEISISELIKNLLKSKKRILLFSFILSLFSISLYLMLTQKYYESTGIIKIGSYKQFSEDSNSEYGKFVNFQSAADLETELIEKFMFNNSENKKITSVTKKYKSFLEVKAKSEKSSEESEKAVREVAEYINNKFGRNISEIQQNILNFLMVVTDKYETDLKKIETEQNENLKRIEREINYISDFLLPTTKQEIKELNIQNDKILKKEKIIYDKRLAVIVEKIKNLGQIIKDEENNLDKLKMNNDLYLQRLGEEPSIESVIYLYKIEMLNLKENKDLMNISSNSEEYILANKNKIAALKKLIKSYENDLVAFENSKKQIEAESESNFEFYSEKTSTNELVNFSFRKKVLINDFSNISNFYKRMLDDSNYINSEISGEIETELKPSSIRQLTTAVFLIILSFMISIFTIIALNFLKNSRNMIS